MTHRHGRWSARALASTARAMSYDDVRHDDVKEVWSVPMDPGYVWRKPQGGIEADRYPRRSDRVDSRQADPPPVN